MIFASEKIIAFNLSFVQMVRCFHGELPHPEFTDLDNPQMYALLGPKDVKHKNLHVLWSRHLCRFIFKMILA